MRKIRLGFVPLHRRGFDEKWAAEVRDSIIKVSSKLNSIELVYSSSTLTENGLISDENDAQKVISLFKEKNVDGILLGTMTFGDELAGIKVAEEFYNYPLAVFGTKEPKIKPLNFKGSDSFCGTLSLTSGLYRRNIPFIFLGVLSPNEEAFSRHLENFARTTAIVRDFVGARLGVLGPRPEPFETCTYNETVMAKIFKQRVVPLTLLSLVEESKKLSDDDHEVKATLEDFKSINVTNVPFEELVKIAKFEVTLRKLVKEKDLDGLGIRCWTEIESYYGIFPCFVMGRLTQSGIMTSCEADIYGALTMLIQYKASLETVPPHFIDWTIMHPNLPNVFLAWHCGNAPPLLACPHYPSTLTYHSGYYKSRGIKCYGTLDTVIKPGEVTICRLTEHEGQFKMLITKGEIIELNDAVSKEALKPGSGAWVKVDDLEKLYKTIALEGFVHHASMIHGDYAESIKQACSILNIKIVEV